MPIIESLLDLDFYKFTMGQLVFLKYRDVPVVYSLTNRTREVRLAEFIDEGELRRELDHVRSLRLNNSELHYLRGTNEYGDRMFRESYLEFLRELELPQYDLEEVDGSFRLQFDGEWSRAIYWETVALSIVGLQAPTRGSIRRQVKRMHDVDEAVLDEHADNLAVPPHMGDAEHAAPGEPLRRPVQLRLRRSQRGR